MPTSLALRCSLGGKYHVRVRHPFGPHDEGSGDRPGSCSPPARLQKFCRPRILRVRLCAERRPLESQVFMAGGLLREFIADCQLLLDIVSIVAGQFLETCSMPE